MRDSTETIFVSEEHIRRACIAIAVPSLMAAFILETTGRGDPSIGIVPFSICMVLLGYLQLKQWPKKRPDTQETCRRTLEKERGLLHCRVNQLIDEGRYSEAKLVQQKEDALTAILYPIEAERFARKP